jgi:serine/threonine protein phosphatase PrpC
MEDAHIALTNLPNNCSLFAVLDGHGGDEVSNVVSKQFPVLLQKNA